MSKSSESATEDVEDILCASAIALCESSSEDLLFNNLENMSLKLDSLDLENQQNIDDLEKLVDSFTDFMYLLIKALPQNDQDKFFAELNLENQVITADHQRSQESNATMDSVELKLAKSHELVTKLVDYQMLGAAVLQTSDNESVPYIGQDFPPSTVDIDTAGAHDSRSIENFDAPVL
jgi:hypothetical protein